MVDYGKFAMPSAERDYKQKVKSLIKDAERFFVQADVWATESFNDKTNVPIHMRLECIRIQLFCAMMIHWDKPQQWLLLWKNIFMNMIRDKGLVQTVLTPFNPWVSRAQKASIRLTLISVVNEAACSLWKIARYDVTMADNAAEVLQFLRSPQNILHERYLETWSNIIALPMNSFCSWNNRLVVVIPDCYRVCYVGKALTVIDRQFRMKIIDPVTLRIIRLKKDDLELNVDLSDKRFCSLCIDHSVKNDLYIQILALQFEPNTIQVLKLDVENSELTSLGSVPVPESGYCLKTTPKKGHWIFRSANGNVYLLNRREKKDWSLITRNVTQLFDVLDEEDLVIDITNDCKDSQESRFYLSYGISLIVDSKLSIFYHNTDGSFIERSAAQINVNSIIPTYQETEPRIGHLQTTMVFDHSSGILLAQRLHNKQLRLSIIDTHTNKSYHQLSFSKSLQFYLFEPIEDVTLCASEVVYIATRRTINFTEQSLVEQSPAVEQLTIIDKTFKMLSFMKSVIGRQRAS
uniref:Uncharacterized protein n=1 Tax=Romanomermis culicivorax TaxID=13658 RepID=A0A915JFP9_ROMCU